MYNKTKKSLSVVSAILAILVGAGSIIMSWFGIMIGIDDNEALLIFMAIASIPLGILSIIFGAKLCKQPVKIENKLTFRKKVYIVLIVFMAILFIFNVLAGNNRFQYYDLADDPICCSYFAFAILGGISLVFGIIALALKSGIVEEQVEELEEVKEQAPEISEKIAQLNALKEEGTITEEQHKEALDKLLNNLVK